MKHLSVAVLLSLSAFAMFAACAQDGESSLPPPAVSPQYLADPATLDAGQVGGMQKQLLDWPNLARYRDDNAALPASEAGRVVFYGDSITDGWGRVPGTEFFPGKPYVNRGISGQTTAQMLLRFRQDVIELRPEAVVILAGTNDIAGNTGPATLDMIEDNLRSMAELAAAHRIRVVLASVLPASAYPWRPGYRPAGRIRALNDWMRRYAADNGLVYLDYYTAMANAEGGLDPELAGDGVHPTPTGYAVMAPLAEQAIATALKQ
ncbi:capsular biosynthesis protein [Pseudoxanthomonas kalamensis DSM 18571]|uniref:SGNH/GDSL hydrolase family protein n=1 Tax=Pseudoxanthomonas kalamensis TaxID=289483 RepID=UPI0013920D0F|nr:SGNH/GDSL hydrolase family protein [Pseudoxanthomonas kalamensis]KAF1711133.1 capsular biosynthesis protein [Pseudoxanthomonas kalamensis DSM 18571]